MATMQMKPVGFFKADPKNPRTSADEKDLDHLGDDMLARGVLVPLLAKPDGSKYFIVANQGSQTVTVLDSTFSNPRSLGNLGTQATAAAITPDGRRKLADAWSRWKLST